MPAERCAFPLCNGARKFIGRIQGSSDEKQLFIGVPNSSSRPRAGLRWVDRGCRSTAHARRSDTLSSALTLSTQPRRRRLEVSPGRLRQDQLVQGEVRHRSPEPRILQFQILQTPHLVALQTAILRPPAEVSRLRHRDRLHRLGDRLALTRQDINLRNLRRSPPLVRLMPIAPSPKNSSTNIRMITSRQTSRGLRATPRRDGNARTPRKT